jgi:collagen type VII alpha
MKHLTPSVLAYTKRRLLLPVACAAAGVAALAAPVAANASVTQTFACTNSAVPQVATAPTGAVSADVTVDGAAGGNGLSGVGGNGESEEFTIPVSGAQQFDVLVGCQSGEPQNPDNGGEAFSIHGPSGGGATQLSPQGHDAAVDAYAIAGAGGGAGGDGSADGTVVGSQPGADGGNASGTSEPGQNGATATDNFGDLPADDGGSGGLGADEPGSVSGVGGAGLYSGGNGTIGSLGVGGSGGTPAVNSTLGAVGGAGGGGGAGILGGNGGGGGAAGNNTSAGGGGGGGGSSYLAPSATLTSAAPSVSDADGSATIIYTIVGSITAPVTQSFGQVQTGTSQTETVTFTNTGSGVDDPATLGGPTISGNDGTYSVTGGSCTAGSHLSDGNSCTITVAFSTATSGDHTATLHLPSNSPTTGDVAVQLAGTALTSSNIVARPSAAEFGDVAVGQTAYKTVTVANTGQLPLNINQLTLTGDADFSIVTDQDFCSAWTVSGQTNCTVQVAYTPTVANAETTTLNIPSDATNNADATVALTATGTPGTNGTTGAPGATGGTGATGTPGTNGTNGSKGTAGATGATGATGASGPQGPAGKSGAGVTSLGLSSRTLNLSADRATHLTLQFKLASAGQVKVTLQREVNGVGWRSVGSETVKSASGPNSVAIGDRFAGHSLTAGRYRVVLQYKHGAKLSSPVGRVFTVKDA